MDSIEGASAVHEGNIRIEELNAIVGMGKQLHGLDTEGLTPTKTEVVRLLRALLRAVQAKGWELGA